MKKREAKMLNQSTGKSNYDKEQWEATSFFVPEEWKMSFMDEWTRFCQEGQQSLTSPATSLLKRIGLLKFGMGVRRRNGTKATRQ